MPWRSPSGPTRSQNHGSERSLEPAVPDPMRTLLFNSLVANFGWNNAVVWLVVLTLSGHFTLVTSK